MDGTKIKYIDQALWLKTIDHYPKTVGEMGLLISVVDLMGIFAPFDLNTIQEMEGAKLDILYAILRITHKIYTKYVDHVVKKILVAQFGKIFYDYLENSPYYQIFFDQLVQDMDYFVSTTIIREYPNMTVATIKPKLLDHIRHMLQKSFYKNIMRKIYYRINDDFYNRHHHIFNKMTNDYLTYSKKALDETYTIMKSFLQLVFSADCTQDIVLGITNSLEKHMDLTALFSENCMELDVYCEQKLDYDRKSITALPSKYKLKIAPKNRHSTDVEL